MEYIRDIHARARKEGRPVLSIEFFPPKTEKGEDTLMRRTLPGLVRLGPDYCSVTYGAGGGTRESTLRIVREIHETHGLVGMAHLTCVGSTRESLRRYLDEARDSGIRNILALRGDPPGGTGEFRPVEGGFEYSYQLAELIRSYGCFSIGAAGFPEGHIACREGREVDWGHLRSKVEAGVEFILTQLFFDNRDYFAFRDHVNGKLGLDVPLCPGVLPILSGRQIRRFATLCGASIPPQMAEALERYGEDDEAVAAYGVEHATRQCRDLLDAGVPGLHFYCLNRVGSTARVVENLGLVPGECSPDSIAFRS